MLTGEQSDILLRHCDRQRKDMQELLDAQLPQLRDIAAQLAPDLLPSLLGRAGTERVKEARTYRGIYTEAPLEAVEACCAGFQSNMTNPTSKWFKLGIPGGGTHSTDNETRQLLNTCEDRLVEFFHISGIYSSIFSFYRHLTVLGTGCFLLLNDDETVMRTVVLTPGTYAIGQNAKGEVNRIVRTFAMTANQLAEEFGADALPEAVREQSMRGNEKTYYEVYCLIEPNTDRRGLPVDRVAKEVMPQRLVEDRDEGGNLVSVHREHWRMRMVYWLGGYGRGGARSGGAYSGILSVSGMDYNPIICARYAREDCEVWGRGIGHKAYKEARGVQMMERDLLDAVGRAVNPPLNVPASLKGNGEGVSIEQGAINFCREVDGKMVGIQPIYNVAIDMSAVSAKLQEKQQIIERAFFNELFMTLRTVRDRTKTAYETERIIKEALELLGGVICNLDHEFLDPLVRAAFAVALEAGVLPEEARGLPVPKVSYISKIHLAQRANATNDLQSFIQILHQAAQVDPQALDILNADEAYRTIAEAMNVPPECINSHEQTAAIREQRAEQQAAQAEQEAQMQQLQAQALQGKAQKDNADAAARLREAGM